MTPSPDRIALESPECVFEVAGCFDLIATAMHGALLKLTPGALVATEKIYALITDEYGLRARLGILRSDAKNRVVQGVGTSQRDLVDLLATAAERVSQSKAIDEIASITNTAAALCVSIYPGKGQTVNFLISTLRSDLEG